MSTTHRIMAAAVALAACLQGAEAPHRRAEDIRNSKVPERRTTSIAKHIEPHGQIKTNVNVNRAFHDAASGRSARDNRTTTSSSRRVETVKKTPPPRFKGDVMRIFNQAAAKPAPVKRETTKITQSVAPPPAPKPRGPKF